jgi:uncharacterized protein
MSHGILKIYASNTDKVGSELLYEHIVYLAKSKGLSGVTVYRGIMGYGMSSTHVTSTRFWELTEKLPVTIEIIDRTEKLNEFYGLIESDLKKMPKGCLVTFEPVEIRLQKKGSEIRIQ